MATTPSRVGPLNVSSRIKTVSAALVFLGVAAFIVCLITDQNRAWYAYLTSYFYFMMLALGGLFFAAIQHASNAGWSVNIRRFSESFTAFLPVGAVTGIILLFGVHHLYEWTDSAVMAKDHILQSKETYLNLPFFIVRLVVFFGGWLLFKKLIVGASLEQDQTGDEQLTYKLVRRSIAFLLFFAVSLSFFSVDLVMSLQPHWFSTIFGIYAFAGLFQSSIAALILLVIYCMKKGLLQGYVDENHLHDLGKFLFAFTVFWAYIAYSQYMLIWYANIPEETVFFLPRVTGAWAWVSVSLILFKFFVPFFGLLSRRVKRVPSYLASICVIVLIIQYVDWYWLIYPNLSHSHVIFGLFEILIFGGFAGAFLLTTFHFLGKYPIVPAQDPRQFESNQHEVIY